jgi:MFS family permease
LWLALAAQLVNAPRLVLIYLRVDHIVLPTIIEGTLLLLTALATGLVLSGGGAYIAHTLATPTKRGGLWKVLLAGVWLAMLLFAVVLVAPLLMASMNTTDIAMTLGTSVYQWLWAIVAVLAVEVMAGGAMLADALKADALPRKVISKDNNVVNKLDNVLPITSVPVIAEPLPKQPTSMTTVERRNVIKASYQELGNEFNGAALARQLHIDPSVVSRDIKYLRDSGILNNGRH